MSFRDRRRRLLGDDSLDTAAGDDRDSLDRTGAAASGNGQNPRAYAAAAESALNRPIREFFPSRLAMMALVAVGGLVLVSVVELGHAWAGRLADVLGADQASVLDLGAPGNASGWLAAMLLSISALVAMFIYGLRRHRVDDYHGRYRVWIWTAIACLVASLAETTSLGALARGLCSRAAAWSGVADTIVWPTVLGAILGVAAIRLLLEVRRCRAALALLLLTGLGFSAAAAIDYGWLEDAASVQPLPLERGCLLAGYVLLLVTLLFYARYVALEIDGLVAVVPARQKPRKIKRAAAAEADEIRVDPPKKPAPHVVRTDLDSVARPAQAAPTAPARQVVASNTASNGGSGQDQRGLSRSERRRLRREGRLQA